MRISIDRMEPRYLLAGSFPTPDEQYMVQLYNWARANPSAVAVKYGIDLNEGLSPGTISTAAKQPLAVNPLLDDSTQTYADFVINTGATLDHMGANGSTPGQRMQDAGYAFILPFDSAENAGITISTSFPDPSAQVAGLFASLYTDGTQFDRGHRKSMMQADLKEIGSGIDTGPYSGLSGFVVVQDMADSGSGNFLTGVAYTDSDHDNFYTPGEQMAGASVIAVRNSDGRQFSTTTWSSGGYTLALPDGTYTVWAGGAALGGWVRDNNVVISGQNVEKDFRPDFVNASSGPAGSFAILTNGTLAITGTSGNDSITLSISGSHLLAQLNLQSQTFAKSSVHSISIDAGDGNDRVSINSGVMAVSVSGGIGNDIIHGGDGNDTLEGDNGADHIWGGAGNDCIFGGNHNDFLYGEAGNDSIWGQNQNDLIDGGTGADLMTGGQGVDTVDYSTRTASLYVELSHDYKAVTGKSGQTGEHDLVLDDIENINGGGGNDRLIGSIFDNILHGNAGNDTIYGEGGIDSLFGDGGKNRLFSAG